MTLIRADKYLTEKGVTESRSRAAELIRGGFVWIDGKQIAKPSTMVPNNRPVEIRDETPAYVSRGGLKLEHALTTFEIDCRGTVALDCGASTGGFTDCLLKHGAERVWAVDVGYGQLHWSLRNDPRVHVMERTNLRTMSTDMFEMPFDLATLDMSFISLKLVLEKVRDLLIPGGRILALIKPQFEAGREHIGSGGVVRDTAIHRRVLEDMAQWCFAHGITVRGITASPITGPKGNREFLFYLVPGSGSFSAMHITWIDKAVKS
ncbi:MAG TPA: TlyA family RNA methyltransferase [bacterium]|nr:TlyA family RNA methyltransferase [bacterium]